MVKSVDEVVSMHDFRVVTGPTHTNLIFDLLVPVKFRLSDEELIQTVQQKVWDEIGENYFLAVKVDKAYVK